MISSSRRFLTLFLVLFATAPCTAQFEFEWNVKTPELPIIRRDAPRHRIAAASRFRRDTLRERIEFDTAGRMIYHRDERWGTSYRYDSLGRPLHREIREIGSGNLLLALVHADLWYTYDAQGRVTMKRLIYGRGGRSLGTRVMKFQYESDGANFRQMTFNEETLTAISDSSVPRRETCVLLCLDSIVKTTRYDHLGRPIFFEERDRYLTRHRQKVLTYDDGVARKLDTVFSGDDGKVYSWTEWMTDTNLRVQEKKSFVMVNAAGRHDAPSELRPSSREFTMFNEGMSPVQWQTFNDEGTLVRELRFAYQKQGLLSAVRREYFGASSDDDVLDSDEEYVVEERWEYDFHPSAPPEKGKIR